MRISRVDNLKTRKKKSVWNKGLTKETSDAVKRSSENRLNRYVFPSGDSNPAKRPEVREKIRLQRLGYINSPETREKIRIGHIGKKFTELHKRNISKSMTLDGRTPLTVAIRNSEEYRNWRFNIFKRDDFRCQECFGTISKRIQAHHIKDFKKLFEEFLQEYNQFSPKEDKDILVRLAINYKPFWEAEGKTVCNECHKKYKKSIRSWGFKI